VIEAGVLDDVVERQSGPGARVLRTIDESLEAGEQRRPRAHRARFERDVEGCAVKPPGAQDLRGIPEGEHLGVGGGIRAQLSLVSGPADDLSSDHYHRPHGNVVVSRRTARLGERRPHELFVLGMGGRGRH